MNKLTPIALTTLTALFAFSGVAFAQDAVTLPASVSPQVPRGPVQRFLDRRIDIKSEIKDVRTEYKTDARNLRKETKERARGATTSEDRRDIRKGFRVERKEIKEERKETVNAMKEQLKVLARQHGNAMGQRFGVALRQFNNLSARIQSRIDKLKSAGTDTNSAESALNTARLAIEQAKTDALALSDLVAQVNSASDAKALRADVETAVKKVSASIRSAHKALGTVAKTLVTSTRPERKIATTTKENN